MDLQDAYRKVDIDDDDEVMTSATTASTDNLFINSSEDLDAAFRKFHPPAASDPSIFNGVHTPVSPLSTDVSSSTSPFREMNHERHFPRPLPVRRSELVFSFSSPIHSSYIVKDKVGQGTWGSVHVATERVSGMERAVKKIPKKFSEEMSRFRQEISILKSMDHPNIARLYETFEDHANLYMVMEYCRGGELFDKISANRFFEEREAAILMQQILSSIYYCHRRNIAHRDLKPENFLFLDKLPDSPLKMIDFGLAKRIAPKRKMRTKVGTLYYVSPQVLEGNYDHSCDLWSAGVILYIMLCGCPPYNGATDAALILAVAKGELEFSEPLWKSKISPEAKSLVTGLLNRDPQTRLTAERALQHAWFKKVSPNAMFVIRSTSLPVLKSAIPSNRRKSICPSSSRPMLPAVSSTNVQTPCCALADVGGHTPFCANTTSRQSTTTISPNPSCPSLDEESTDHDIFQLGNIATQLVPKWRRFATMNQLKRTFLNLVANQICDSGPLRAYRSLFLALDSNGDGILSSEEIAPALQTLGELHQYLVVQDEDTGAHEVLDESQAEAMANELKMLFRHVDLDGNGTVEYSEFLASCLSEGEHLSSVACKAAFRILDRDADGRVSLNEIRAALGWTTSGFYPSLVKLEYGDRSQSNEFPSESTTDEKLVDELLRGADLDGDGFLDFEDFMRCLTEP